MQLCRSPSWRWDSLAGGFVQQSPMVAILHQPAVRSRRCTPHPQRPGDRVLGLERGPGCGQEAGGSRSSDTRRGRGTFLHRHYGDTVAGVALVGGSPCSYSNRLRNLSIAWSGVRSTPRQRCRNRREPPRQLTGTSMGSCDHRGTARASCIEVRILVRPRTTLSSSRSPNTEIQWRSRTDQARRGVPLSARLLLAGTGCL